MNHEQAQNYLMHYGVPGMKWGQRKQRVTLGRHERRAARYEAKAQRVQAKAAKARYKNTAEGRAEAKAARKKAAKTAAKVGAAAVATALAAYGTQKMVKNASMKAWSRKGEDIYKQTVQKSLNATSKMVKKGTHAYGAGTQQSIANQAGAAARRRYMQQHSGETFREAAKHLRYMKRNHTRY